MLVRVWGSEWGVRTGVIGRGLRARGASPTGTKCPEVRQGDEIERERGAERTAATGAPCTVSPKLPAPARTVTMGSAETAGILFQVRKPLALQRAPRSVLSFLSGCRNPPRAVASRSNRLAGASRRSALAPLVHPRGVRRTGPARRARVRAPCGRRRAGPPEGTRGRRARAGSVRSARDARVADSRARSRARASEAGRAGDGRRPRRRAGGGDERGLRRRALGPGRLSRRHRARPAWTWRA